jgi:hypothetical protein
MNQLQLWRQFLPEARLQTIQDGFDNIHARRTASQAKMPVQIKRQENLKTWFGRFSTTSILVGMGDEEVSNWAYG